MSVKLIVWNKKHTGTTRKVEYSCETPQEARKLAQSFKGMKTKVVGHKPVRSNMRGPTDVMAECYGW